MQREDMLRLADALAGSKPREDASRFNQWLADCDAVADMIAKYVKKFDRQLFLKNCRGG